MLKKIFSEGSKVTIINTSSFDDPNEEKGAGHSHKKNKKNKGDKKKDKKAKKEGKKQKKEGKKQKKKDKKAKKDKKKKEKALRQEARGY